MLFNHAGIIVRGRLHLKHPLLGMGGGWGRGRFMCRSAHPHTNGAFLLVWHFTMFLSWARGGAGAAEKRDKLVRSHFFSITSARLQGWHAQWVLHRDGPSRKHFN